MGARFDELIDLRDHIPEHLRRYLKQAKIFEFDMLPIDTLNNIDVSKIGKLAEGLVMPFPVVAIEDKAGVVIIISDKDKLLDTNVDRTCITYQMVIENSYRPNQSDDEFYERVGLGRLFETKKEEDIVGSQMIYTGRFMVGWDNDIYKWAIDMDKCDLYSAYIKMNDGRENDFDFTNSDKMTYYNQVRMLCMRDFHRGVITAYEELLPLGDYDKVILREELILSEREKKRLPKYRKTHQRAKYTIVRPNEARRIMGLSEPQPKTEGGRIIKERRAHWRREHERTLHHPKFGDKVGTTKTIPKTFIAAVWNGDDESTCGNKHYKVIYDLS